MELEVDFKRGNDYNGEKRKGKNGGKKSMR